jgi:diaminopimelate epimerase
MQAQVTQFRKMNGLGNDFVVLDARSRALALSPEAVRAIADREAGIGCDQLIALEPSSRADVFMRIFNADGGEVGACGNAARCVAALVAAERGQFHVSIETESGVLGAVVNDDGTVTIDMNAPRFAWNEIPLSEPFHDTRRIELQIGPIDDPVLHSPSVVNVGNPHCLFFVEDVEAHDLARFGPMLEHHPLFPERANISLVQVLGPEAIRVRTWERGAGLTRACGTAACAAAVAAARRKLIGRKVTVSLPGGDLQIEWRESDGHILMTGPYALDYEGTLPAELLQPAAAASTHTSP